MEASRGGRNGQPCLPSIIDWTWDATGERLALVLGGEVWILFGLVERLHVVLRGLHKVGCRILYYFPEMCEVLTSLLLAVIESTTTAAIIFRMQAALSSARPPPSTTASGCVAILATSSDPVVRARLVGIARPPPSLQLAASASAPLSTTDGSGHADLRLPVGAWRVSSLQGFRPGSLLTLSMGAKEHYNLPLYFRAA